ncbi:MAG: hypothetical protein LBR82_01960 [Desulfovibrio sp.]|nr:hypothetical protein [Desulfovibrio sp.]
MAEDIQVHVDAADCTVYARSTATGAGGQWSAWRRLDTKRLPNGTLDETVKRTEEADRADKADKFTTPVTITFTGDIAGSLTFDGATQKITCHLTVPGVPAAIQAAINAAIPSYPSYPSTPYYDGGGG